MKEPTKDSCREVSNPAPRDGLTNAWWTVLAAALGFRRTPFRKYCCGSASFVARRRLLRKLRRQWDDHEE